MFKLSGLIKQSNEGEMEGFVSGHGYGYGFGDWFGNGVGDGSVLDFDKGIEGQYPYFDSKYGSDREFLLGRFKCLD